MRDFHCHLNHPELFLQRKDLWEEFVKTWGTGIIIPWVDPAYNSNMIKILSDRDDRLIFGCLGFHPCRVAETLDEELIDILRENYQMILNTAQWWNTSPRVGIGECGIDLHHCDKKTTLHQQKRFAKQIVYAIANNLPIVVHSRDAFEQTQEVMDQHPNAQYYLHCRTYWWNETEKILSKHPTSVFGFGWVVTYPKATDTHEVCRKLPLSHIVLETDAPYLAPQVMRGKQNTPSLITHTYAEVAKIHNISSDELISIQEANWTRLWKR